MTITIITAVDNNGGIGLNGKLPWHVPAELTHFHNTIAQGDYVTVCGAKTFSSLPLSLRKRTIVWSERMEAVPDGGGWVVRPYTTEHILSMAENNHVAIIGGAVTYAAFMPYADKLLISHIHGNFDHDAKFPFIDNLVWDWAIRQTPRMVCAQSGLTWDVWELPRLKAVQPCP
jgi:dihydrofolate reductase